AATIPPRDSTTVEAWLDGVRGGSTRNPLLSTAGGACEKPGHDRRMPKSSMAPPNSRVRLGQYVTGLTWHICLNATRSFKVGMSYRCSAFTVVRGQSSVRNGDAGNPALFERLTTG